MSATGLRLVIYIKIANFVTYTLSTGANPDRFPPRFLRRLPHRPEKTTLLGAAWAAVAGGAGAGHRDRDDVGPLLAGASETTASPFFCLPVYIRNEMLPARCARGAGLGDGGIGLGNGLCGASRSLGSTETLARAEGENC